MKDALVIDGDQGARERLAGALRRAGWEAREAGDVQAALAVADEYKPELILCSVHLPGSNGFHFCRALRENNRIPATTRIVLISASQYAIDRLSAVEAGANDFWIRPITAENLLIKVGRPPEFNRSKHQVPKVGFGSIGPQGAVPWRPPQPGERTMVRFWGVRGSIPTPGPDTALYGGNTACVEVRAGGRVIILDGGTGIRALGSALMTEAQGKGVDCDILISHMHWDHIQGLAFFAPAYDPRSRIWIYGFPNAERGLQESLSMLMRSPHFPIDWRQLPSQIQVEELREPEFNLGVVKVRAIWMNHPGICAGYRLDTPHGSIAYLPDHEPFQRYVSVASTGSGSVAERMEFARGQDEMLRSFIAGCSLLIVDSQYDSNEYADYVGWGHGCAADAIQLAVDTKVKEVCLFHHDPSHDDGHLTRMSREAQEMASAADSRLIVHCAREGLEIRL